MKGRFEFTRRGALSVLTGAIAAGALPAFAEEGADAPVLQVMTLGAEDAPVTMIEYASFTCPHCKNFHLNVLPELKAKYIDTGKVKIEYRGVYFDPLGLWADMIARCGGPERYFGIAKLLYERQAEWTKGETGMEIAENLFGIGRIAGLAQEDMDVCIRDNDTAQALVAQSTAQMEADGIEGTPTFVINGELFKNQPIDGFIQKLDSLLAE